MNESQTKHDFIDPALKEAGWGVVEGSQVRLDSPVTVHKSIHISLLYSVRVNIYVYSLYLLLEKKLGAIRFTWGGRELAEVNECRQNYIQALQKVDHGNIAPLLNFVRS